MSSKTVINVEKVSKAYTIWTSPAARLHGAILGQIGQMPLLPSRLRQACHGLLRQSCREFFALKDVCLEVRKGESVGIIGRNGSGKSTLLQIIAGTLTPTAGRLSVQGRVAALLELGSGFNPEFTGRENVYLNASIIGLSRKEIESKFDEIAAFAEIGDFIDQPTKTYSSGMLVRLAFAVAVHVRPEILIVDEALAVGDIFFQQKCIRHMQEQMQGITKVLVTHDLQAVTNFTNRVYVLDQAEVIFVGPPKEAVETYTKLAHNAVFKRPASSRSLRTTAPTTGANWQSAELDRLPWIRVNENARGGAQEIQITSVAVTDVTGEPIQAIQAKDRAVVHLLVTCLVPKDRVLVGYIINDRLGNGICGETTCSVSEGVFPLATGRHLVEFDFEWPPIRPGEYTITIGAGEGDDPTNHIIQCWAHNIAKFSAISPGRVVHCLFNNALSNLKVRPLACAVSLPGQNRTDGLDSAVAENREECGQASVHDPVLECSENDPGMRS